jgi:hypothetical protein
MGSLSRILAFLLKPRRPPVLVLSLPRSGSSWIGETLGSAADALYLREPVTQSDDAFRNLGTVFSPEDPKISGAYRSLADRAFLGCPDFGSHIVIFAGQWSLTSRVSRRLVIKEVNPLACQWYIGHYQPFIVFLLRHPAAVAWSMHRMGWLGMDSEDWRESGDFQGRALRSAKEALEEYERHCLILYEDLCANPRQQFERLYMYAGLRWGKGICDFIAAKTADYDGTGTGRDSRVMAERWREVVPGENAAALRQSFEKYDLPWYREGW